MTQLAPVGLPGLAALAAGWFAFFAAVTATRTRRGDEREAGGTRSRRSLVGVLVQGAGFALAWAGPVRVALDPLGTAALVEAALVAALMAASVTLFGWSARTMGRNWSIVARTRGDHQLVTAGPFRWVRHPIYTAMLLGLLATAIGMGHYPQLAAALPAFALGTWLRIREEERLLADRFGDAYRRYAATTPRFVPGLF